MQSDQTRIACLDGMRGVAALWVIIGHALILTGWHIRVIGDPDLAVDLFILLSGFLMVFNHPPDSQRYPWSDPSSAFGFWKKRFFRIAPLYYLLLVVALGVGSYVYQTRMTIDTFLGVVPQLAERYTDNGFTNIAMHFSFLFGLSPEYAYRTALPDWSIGLEMGFYAVFPLLMILVLRFGWVVGSVIVLVLAGLCVTGMHFWQVHFPMPAFLPMKMNVFISGMLLAASLQMPARSVLLYYAFASIAVILPFAGDKSILKEAARLGIVAGFFLLVHHRHLPQLISPAVKWISDGVLGSRVAKYLGDWSFGAYLIHLLVMQPVIAMLISAYGRDMSTQVRFGTALLITLPIVYALAAASFYFVEMPAQRLGRSMKLSPGRKLPPTSASGDA